MIRFPLSLFTLFLAGSATAEVVINAGAELTVHGTISSAVQITDGGTLSGTGIVGGNVTGAGTVSPGTSISPTGTLTLSGNVTTTGPYLCEIDGVSADKIAIGSTIDISSAQLNFIEGAGGFTEAVYLLATYGTLTGSEFASVQNLPTGYKIAYAYDPGTGATNIALVQLSAFETWGVALALPAGQDGADDDPNNDGTPNIAHFAFDTDPLGSGTDEGKRQMAVAEIDGSDYFTLTIPIRLGAIFSGDPLVSNEIDGLTYSILGDTDLQDPWDLPLTEVLPALDTGLPALGDYDGSTGSDWEYRTFRMTDPFSDHQRAFMKAEVTTP
ncbi:MAG: hypothetical protein GY953_36990 [bacterium]|nr:hypothetical protein [bacterium]